VGADLEVGDVDPTVAETLDGVPAIGLPFDPST
jgi:hypothetical protein